MLSVSNDFKNTIKQLSVYSDGKVIMTDSSGYTIVPLTNILQDGNFAAGAENNISGYFCDEVIENVGGNNYFKAYNSSNSTRITVYSTNYKGLNTPIVANNKYYFYSKYLTSVACDIEFSLYATSPTAFYKTTATTSTTGTWLSHSGIITPLGNYTTTYIEFKLKGVVTPADYVYYDDLILVNLTASFGAGNEPTKEQMDDFISKNGYFDTTNYVTGKVIVFNDISKIEVTGSAFNNGRVHGNLAQHSLVVELLGNQTSSIDLTQENILNIQFGVKVGASYEYVEYQDFLVLETEYSDTTNITRIIATDYLVKLNKVFIDSNTYPMSLYDYAVSVLTFCGLELENASFFNGDFVVAEKPFSNTTNCRNIIEYISELALCFVMINKVTNKVEFKKAFDRFMRGYTHEELADFTHEELADFTHYELMNAYGNQDDDITKAQYWSFKLKDNSFGKLGFNTVIIRDSQLVGEEVAEEEPSMVLEDGTIALVIADNPFLYTEAKRTEAIDGMLTEIVSYKYSPYILEYRGFPYLEIGDIAAITKMDNSIFYSPVYDVVIRYDGGLFGRITAEALSKGAATYRQIGSLNDKVKTAEVIVDKLNGEVTIMAGDYYDGKLVGTYYTFDGDGFSMTNSSDEIVFYADANGDLTLTGTITGSTVIGSTIKSSLGDDRIEFDNTSLRSYYTAVKRVELDYEKIKFYDPDSNLNGQIFAYDGYLLMATADNFSTTPSAAVTMKDTATDSLSAMAAFSGVSDDRAEVNVSYSPTYGYITQLTAKDDAHSTKSQINLVATATEDYISFNSLDQAYYIYIAGANRQITRDANGFLKC